MARYKPNYSNVRHPDSNATVYRFGDLVAVHVPGMDETGYISSAEAKRLARALNKAARSIATEAFTDNTCGTIKVPLVRTDRFRGLLDH